MYNKQSKTIVKKSLMTYDKKKYFIVLCSLNIKENERTGRQ
jgi:hypothetical protein